jgi:hypothetical protein
MPGRWLDPGEGLDVLAVSSWTGNGHEVGQQFADDSLDLFVGGFAEHTGEDRMRH